MTDLKSSDTKDNAILFTTFSELLCCGQNERVNILVPYGTFYTKMGLVDFIL